MTGVDERFHKKILGKSGSEDVSLRCSEAGCLPDFVTIGAQKGGTTSFYYYLQQYHTGIETSKHQELNFFSERSHAISKINMSKI